MAQNCNVNNATGKIKGGTVENLFCSMVKVQYNTLTTALDLVANFPLGLITTFKSTIKMIEKIVYKKIDAEVTIAENLLLELIKFQKFNKSANKENFCQVAFGCEALVNMISAKYPNSDLRKDYALFEKYACRVGLDSLMKGYMAEQLAKLQILIDKFNEILWEKLGLNAFTAKYDAFIHTKWPILVYDSTSRDLFQWLALLDVFMKCAFSVCDFTESAVNKKLDITTKLAINQSGTAIELTSLTANISKLDARLTKRLNTMQSIIDSFGLNCGERVAREDIADIPNKSTANIA